MLRTICAHETLVSEARQMGILHRSYISESPNWESRGSDIARIHFADLARTN